ncbi:hypothetical protein EG68_06518 [Paragonimus skrjabini miyazakii]|uniref:Uncharacterized protein n=1 Tax=Paragonimus skrjabini miyazakii TaxID=59628 RepID=A0A8S9YG77_9TREM|nr:hypothetical protein EG68_06518 [Paragonimus skrjabini miyazakii]
MTVNGRESKNMRRETVREESVHSQTERNLRHSRKSFCSTPSNARAKPSDRRLLPHEHAWYNETVTAVSTKYSLMRRTKSEQNMSVADRNNPVGGQNKAADIIMHTRTKFVRIKPPRLPALFVVRLGTEVPTWNTRLVDSTHEDILRISMPHMTSDDIPTELLSACLERIAIHSPKWQTLSIDERTAFSIQEQLEWLKDCLVHASTADNSKYFCFEMWNQLSGTESEQFQSVNQLLQDLFNQVNALTFNIPFCTVRMVRKTVGVCLMLLLQTMKNRLDEILCTQMTGAHPSCSTSYHACVALDDSPESPSGTRSHWSSKFPKQYNPGSLIDSKGDLLPAEIVSVNLPCTPTMATTHDFDAKFTYSPLAKSISSFGLTSEFWESSPMVRPTVPILTVSHKTVDTQERLKRSRSSSPLVLRQTPSDANADRLFDLMSGPANCRQILVYEDRSTNYQEHEQLKHLCKNPWRHSTPEGLDRLQYYRLTFSPPTFLENAEGNSPFHYSDGQRRPEDQKVITVLDSSTMPQGDHLPGHTVREQLGMQIISIIIKAILAKTHNSLIQCSECFSRSFSDPTVSDQVQTFVDQAIAITVTHTMNTNLRGSPTQLSQLVTSAPINVSLVMDKLLLHSLLAENFLEPRKKSLELNLPGECRIYQSAKELVQRVSKVINVVLNEETCETEIARNLTRHVLQLAFPAVRFAVKQLLMQSDTGPLWNSRKRFSSQPELLDNQTALLGQQQQPLTWSATVIPTIPLTQPVKASRSSTEPVASDLNLNSPVVLERAEPAEIGHACNRQTDRYSRSPAVNCRAEILLDSKQDCLNRQESMQPNVATNLTRPSLDAEERSCLLLSCADVEYISPQPLTHNELSSPEKMARRYLSVLSSRSEYVTDLENEYTSTTSSSYAEPVRRPEVKPRFMVEKACNISVQVVFGPSFGADQSTCQMKVSSGQNELTNSTLIEYGVDNSSAVTLCKNCSEQLLRCIKHTDCGSQIDYISNHLCIQSTVAHSNANTFDRVESRQSRVNFMDRRPSKQNSTNTTHITDDRKKLDPPTRSNCVSAIRLDSEEEMSYEVNAQLMDENETKVTVDDGANEHQLTGSTSRQAINLPAVNQTSFMPNEGDAEMKQVNLDTADKANRRENGNLKERTKTRTNPSEWRGPAFSKNNKTQRFIPSNLGKVSNTQSSGGGVRMKTQCNKASTWSKTPKGLPYMSNQKSGQRGDKKCQPIPESNPLDCDTTKQDQESNIPKCLDEAFRINAKPYTQSSPHPSMDPFYSCLEELRECLMRAESRLDVVSQLAAHDMHQEDLRYTGDRTLCTRKPSGNEARSQYKRSAVNKHTGRWPSTSHLASSDTPRQTESTLPEKYPLKSDLTYISANQCVTRTLPNCESLHSHRCYQLNNLTPASTARWTVDEVRSRGPAHFPGPCMELPISKSLSGKRVVTHLDGTSYQLLYAKRSNTTSAPTQRRWVKAPTRSPRGRIAEVLTQNSPRQTQRLCTLTASIVH